MNTMKRNLVCAMSLICFVAVGCLGTTAGKDNAAPGTYSLTVTSMNPTSGLALSVSPADLNNAGASGAPTPETNLSLVYDAGAAVTITAPATNSIGSAFFAWIGCDSTTGYVCTVTMSETKSVQVQYAGVSSVVINPSTINVTVGGGVQVPVTVNGYGMCTQTNPTGPPTQVQCAGSAVTCSDYANTTGDVGMIDPATCYFTSDAGTASSLTVTATSTVSQGVKAQGLISVQQ